THVNGQPLLTKNDLMLAIGKQDVGQRVELTVLRNGQRLVLSATLTKNNIPGKKVVTNPEPAWRGLRVEYPSALRPLSLTFTGAGPDPIPSGCVIITEVAAGSPAAALGLRPGMRISRVGE